MLQHSTAKNIFSFSGNLSPIELEILRGGFLGMEYSANARITPHTLKNESKL